MKTVRGFMRAHRRLAGERRVTAWIETRRWCFSQDDLTVANAAGATVRADINSNIQALGTFMSGATAPATMFAYMPWADTTLGLMKQRNAANSAWLVRGTLGETFVVARSSNTILAGGDYQRMFKATSTFTQTLTAAATLGDGWYCGFRNDGTGVITIDPNSTETIDGATTLDLYAGESCWIWCDGSNFKTLGRHSPGFKLGTFTRDTSLATGTQAVTGVGFKPRAVIFLSGITGGASNLFSVGIDDGTSHCDVFDNSGNVAGTNAISTGHSICGIEGVGVSYSGSISSLDTDGFTFSWTKAGAAAGTLTVAYLALR